MTTQTEDRAEFNAWRAQNPELLSPLSCAESSHVGRWNGLICEMLEYHYAQN